MVPHGLQGTKIGSATLIAVLYCACSLACSSAFSACSSTFLACGMPTGSGALCSIKIWLRHLPAVHSKCIGLEAKGRGEMGAIGVPG